MPLRSGKSEATMQANFAKLRSEGHGPDDSWRKSMKKAGKSKNLKKKLNKKKK